MPKRAEISDTMTHRRIIQWIQILSAAQVNDIEELRALQSELERWLMAPDSQEGKPPADTLEAMAKELLVKRNAWTRALGYPGYRDLVLYVSGIKPEELQYWLYMIDTLTIQPYRALIGELKEENGIEELSLQDIYRLYFNYFQSSPPDPTAEERQKVISSTLNGLGMKFEELPILQREMQLPPPMGGQGISVRIPDNFKLVITPGLGLPVLLHEIGHGLACVYSRMPYAVLKGYEWLEGGDSPVIAEGLAEWAGNITRNPEWMKKYTSLSEEEIAKKTEAYKKYAPINLRFWLYNVWLELEIFNNPEQDLDSVSNALMTTILLVDQPPSQQTGLANSMYVSYPVYLHNYLFAEIIQWQIHNELKNRLGDQYLFNPETAKLMQEYFYKDGEYYHWQERLGRFTGEGLDIEGYMNWLRE
jgi:hypothetical protein